MLFIKAIYQATEFIVFWKPNTLQDILGGKTSEYIQLHSGNSVQRFCYSECA